MTELPSGNQDVHCVFVTGTESLSGIGKATSLSTYLMTMNVAMYTGVESELLPIS